MTKKEIACRYSIIKRLVKKGFEMYQLAEKDKKDEMIEDVLSIIFKQCKSDLEREQTLLMVNTAVHEFFHEPDKIEVKIDDRK